MRSISVRMSVALLWSALLYTGDSSGAAGQTAVANGEVVKEPHFPPRGTYKNPNAIVQVYDSMADLTRVRLGIVSGNLFTLLLKPIVQLDFEATFNGAQPTAAPDSVVMTSRMFRLVVRKEPPGGNVQPTIAQQQPLSPGSTGPMLSFMVAASPNGTSAASAPTWRTSVASIVTGSNDLVTVDDTGIWFRGQRWLSIVTNVLDLRRQKGEMPLRLLARGDTGRFSLVSLPERVRNVLREGLRLTISEDVHRLAIPTSTLLQMTSARDGVKSRFGTVDFAIQGDELNALQDFASRLAPIESRGDGVRLQAPTPSSSDSAKSASIPAGTEIEMASSSRECTDSVRLGDQFGATVTKPVATSAGALLDAGTPVRLMISDLKQGTHPADPVDARMSAVSVTLAGHEYALAGTIVRYTKVRQPDSSGFCVPKNGALVLRLRRPFELP